MLYPASSFLRHDPFALMRRMSEGFDRGYPGDLAGRGFPAVNVWHGSEAAAVTAELPGVEAADIQLSVKDNVLTLTGERRRPEPGEKATSLLRERAFGPFSRAVRIAFAIDPDKVEARVENGVLQVMLHRRDEDKPRRIDVKAA